MTTYDYTSTTGHERAYPKTSDVAFWGKAEVKAWVEYVERAARLRLSPGLFQAVDYAKKRAAAKEEGKPKPPVPTKYVYIDFESVPKGLEEYKHIRFTFKLGKIKGRGGWKLKSTENNADGKWL